MPSECLSCIVPSTHFPAKYTINLASHRREPSVDLGLNDINDILNGILLAVQLHKAFGASEAAFLRVSLSYST
jgi:HNH endonuclease